MDGKTLKEIVEKVIIEVQKKYSDVKEIRVGIFHFNEEKGPYVEEFTICTGEDDEEYVDMYLADVLDGELKELMKYCGFHYVIDVNDRDVY